MRERNMMTFEIWSPHCSRIPACDRCLREKRQQILKVIIHTDREAVLKHDTSQELLLLILILFQVKEDALSALNCAERQEKKLFSSSVIARQDCFQRFRETKNTLFRADSWDADTKKSVMVQ